MKTSNFKGPSRLLRRPWCYRAGLVPTRSTSTLSRFALFLFRKGGFLRELTSGFCLRFPVCCTRTPSMSSTTTPLGASERKHCQCLCSPLRPRGRAGVFRRRGGPASQSLPGTASSFFSRLSAGYLRGVSTSGGFAAAGPSLVWVRFPYVSAYVFTFAGVYARWVRVPGRPDVFPGRDRHRVWPSQLISLAH